MTEKLWDLKRIFELRNQTSLKSRRSWGRVCQINHQWGIYNAVCTLWPVAIPFPVKENDVVVFEGEFFERILTINKILETVDSQYLKPLYDMESLLLKEDPYLLECLTSSDDLTTRETNYFTSPFKEKHRVLKTRESLLKLIRHFFEVRDFIPMDTPTLVPSGSLETHLTPFRTKYLDFKGDEWLLELPTSPELPLKKVLFQGFSNIYQIAHAYRNKGELSRSHEPEFLMLEWYRIGASLEDIIYDTRKLLFSLIDFLGEKETYPHHMNWPVFTVEELFKKHCQISLEDVQETSRFYEAAKTKSSSVNTEDDWDSLFCKLFMERIEPELTIHPVCFVKYYPRQMGALAQVSKKNPLFVERCECFVKGIEIMNGYHELSDITELKQRLSNNIENSQSNYPKIQRDRLFESLMEKGFPPSSGNALGLDRLIATLLNKKISEVLPLPFLEQFESIAQEFKDIT